MKRFAIYALAAGCLFCLTGPLAAALPDPVIYIPFNADWDAQVGASVGAADWSVAANRAPYSVPGVWGNALQLDPAGHHTPCGTVYYDGGAVATALNAGLEQFTICGWFKAEDTAPTNGDNLLFRNGNGGVAQDVGYLRLIWDQYGRMRLYVNDKAEDQWHWFNIADQWVFFAVTYDSSQTTDNVIWYRGDEQSFSGLQAGHTTYYGSLDAGTLGSSDQPLVLGNGPITGEYSYDGGLDEIRLYNQVLTPAQIDEVRLLINQPDGGAQLYSPAPAALFYLPYDGSWDNEGTAGVDVVDVSSGYDEETNTLVGPGFAPGLRGQCLDLSCRASQTDYLGGGGVWYGDAAEPNSPMRNAMNGLRSFTVCGWMRLDGPDGTTLGNGSTPFFFQKRNGQMYEYKMRFLTDQWGRPRVVLNHNWGPTEPWEWWNFKPETGWSFKAVTYDADAFLQEERFYYGAPSTTVNFRCVRNHSAGVLEDSSEPIGIFPSYDGYVDELYLFGSKHDSSGALSLEQIQYIAAMVNQGILCGTEGYVSPEGDFNNDCVVDLNDLLELVNNWLLGR